MNDKATVADILDAAADLIEPKGAWTQGEVARNAEGKWVIPRGSIAVCWCAMGAIARAAGPRDTLSFEATCALERMVGNIPNWNDAPERTQAEVVAKLREAAATAREQGK